jgi:hypothetical protein
MPEYNVEDRIDIFLDLFRQALSNVDNSYYGSHWWIKPRLDDYLRPDDENRETIEEYLFRFSERVFCYEQYHQVRKLMEEFEEQNPEILSNVLLQGELEKGQIGRVIEEFFGVRALSHEYIPDFLLHSPGHFDSQDLIIEVKSNPEITFSGIKPDLLKIQEFILRYRYNRGVFLTINTEPDRMERTLAVENNRRWIQQELSERERIIFMCKQQNDAPLFECKLGDLAP